MIFSNAILNWYDENKRKMPWRKTKDPYKIWLSEIILQQTKVNQGIPYYKRFIKKYPSIKSLSKASEDDILKLWEGLGYYSRARNIYKTTQLLINKHDGNFPVTFNEIINLPGIGPYTAAAISSICFNLKEAVLDGNVFRVLARYFNITLASKTTEGKNVFLKLAKNLIPNKRCGDYNQAIMEFGALICTPKLPKCEECILNASCLGLKFKKVSLLPTKQKRHPAKTRYFNYFVIYIKDSLFIQKRINNDIWKHLYEFPLIESHKEMTKNEMQKEEKYLIFTKHFGFKNINLLKSTSHKLSHQEINCRFWLADKASILKKENKKLLKVKKNKLKDFTFPRIIQKDLKNFL